MLILAQTDAFATFVATITRAVALGCIYAVVALGFVIVFKATQVLNFAHGGIAMAGALFLSIMVNDDGFPFLPFGNPFVGDEPPGLAIWLLMLALAMVLTAILAMVLERVAIRPMVGQPLFALAIITLGIEIAISAFNRDAVNTPDARTLHIPWGVDQWEIFGARVNHSYLAAVIAALFSFGVVFFFYRSRLGVAMRAVAFDQEAAMAQGINVGRVFQIAWAIGGALACLGAVIYAMAPFGPQGAVSADLHPVLAFRALPVIILGGLDSVTGALIGGLVIGGAEVLAGQYFSDYTTVLGVGYQAIVPYVIMLGVLLVRPYGLFGTEEIRRV
ncbi:MAG: branched-chain amino acid ABC transporter permease [Acidimicrobiia bacterium]|nr:branched-chain amino acid ABC transporter permease [Acidimicrobiia bacterium]